MAAKEQTLQQRIKELERSLRLNEAFFLAKYPPPPTLELKKELAATDQKTRFGQPFVMAWIARQDFDPHKLNAKRQVIAREVDDLVETAFDFRSDALIHMRNALALQCAAKLAYLDAEIAIEREAEHLANHFDEGPYNEQVTVMRDGEDSSVLVVNTVIPNSEMATIVGENTDAQ